VFCERCSCSQEGIANIIAESGIRYQKKIMRLKEGE
jgi:hypothetical protein